MKNLKRHLSLFPVLLLILISTGCKKEKEATPVVLSLSAANITTSTATSGGNIINEGSSQVSASGVCWSTDPNPTVFDSKTTDGSRIGKYVSSINGLTPGTRYYLRSYATNSAGTSYGIEESFTSAEPGSTVTDIEGNVYGIITIGDQVWMKENLRTTKYSNGDLIGTSPTAQLIREKAYEWPVNNSESWSMRYGRLYTWFAATDSRKICPSGWHVPSDSEWKTLSEYLIKNGKGFNGSGNLIGKSLAATSDWAISNLTGSVGYIVSTNNTSGFEGLPAGYMMNGQVSGYRAIGEVTYWWSSTPVENELVAWVRELYYPEGTLIEVFGDRSLGFSIRCLKD